ncbi:3-oxoacyl-ACP reductase [Streptomyces sp. FIT100]|uniref:3-oxoacyl-ACP reductase n=1 Tax=Streptomyces sp. FIT100 TaxID=2837956 RepID=UPI0021CAB09A|nr:3-oxoacyl-ACP reductase [Streptomyces sp. FIT100]UUN28507.1 3-oxoacyl-ACP reductase [Streptomyces sp. FIT100]
MADRTPDRYQRFARTAPGRFLTHRLGLPEPAVLRRWSPERPSLDGELLHLTAAGPADAALGAVLARTGLPVATASERPAAVVLDATGVATAGALAGVHAALHPVVRSVAASGRVVVLGAPPSPTDHHQAAAQQALEGFVRSLGKEIGRGRTVNLVRVGGAVQEAESTLRFLLSPRSAYVSGQVVEIGARTGGGTGSGSGGPSGPSGRSGEGPDGTSGSAGNGPEDASRDRTAADRAAGWAGDWSGVWSGDWSRPLAGRTALVTGAARGIGAAVAGALARDGAHVVCLDVPAAQADLLRTAEALGGSALPLDITAADAADRMAAATGDGLDILIHNAGITRDRRLANMSADRWASVLDVNLAAVLDTTDTLLKSGALRPGGRVVATASIAGIAGNTGQTNYAASKAGIIGMVRSLAPRAAAHHGVTVNAVAPGFIETRMTAAVPFLIREAGRRMNSLAQGGLPDDVAETTAWLSHPASAAVNGQVVRVCGQSLLGA